jgi:fructose-1,6-bisphosphatase/inositol monophosphatase family enzyme
MTLASLPIPTAALHYAVREAARLAILPRFRMLAEGEISQKTGPNDLVTIADTEAETLISASLARDWPQALVLGEEGVAKDPGLRAAMGTADPAVIVDPVDGTWNFAHGLAVFGVLLAVARAGRPVWGMLYDPVCDDWVEAAEGAPTRMATPSSSRLLRTAAPKPVAELGGYIPLGLYPEARKRDVALAGLGFGRVTSLRCSAQEYRLLAQGHVDFVLSGPTPHPWDHAAGVLAVQGAGGVTRFLDGGGYDTVRVAGVLLSASCEAVWAQVARAYAALA